MKARRITVTFVNTVSAEASGYGSRGLLTELRGRPPVYNSTSRAWHTQPDTARDLIAVAESRGYEVVVIGGAC